MPREIETPVPAERSNAHPSIEVRVDEEIAASFRRVGLSVDRIREAVVAAASIGDCTLCEIGVRVTDDEQIHQINREFLQHDYPTDVISFPYELAPPKVEGELVVSLDTATACAPDEKLSIAEELLLYVVHGTLHIVGYDDTSDEPRQRMRAAEQAAMKLIGVAINKVGNDE